MPEADSQPSPTIPNHCSATRRDGQPCRAPAVGPSGLCFSHDPARVVARVEANQRGGRHKARIIRLRGLIPPRLLPIFDVLEAALGEVHEATITPQQAGAMASLARAMVAVLSAGELEERVRNLEREASEVRGG